ncbi:hypothetical protein IMSHALPRED_003932 [Imshaugia aleurites]|uniref:Uncharacterized protein n=1 Tax=Imshaugia aleurites TaxID=172621 RepID=A0A8H3I5N7_9LECA|nr:hypothetical protein IMSHALPRED_003932 [Imshaugia aleurites]
MPCGALGYSDPVASLGDLGICGGPRLADDTPTSSTSISVDVSGGTINPSTHSDYLEAVHTLVESSSTAPTLGTNASELEIQTSEGKAALTYSASRTISPPAIKTQTGLGFGTQTFTASSKSQNIIDSGRTLSSELETFGAGSEFQPFSSKTTPMNGPSSSTAGAESIRLPAASVVSQTVESNDRNRYILGNGETITLGSTTMLGSSISTTIPGLRTSGSQIPFVSGSDISLLSLLSPATAAPAVPGTPTTLTTGGNAITANTFAYSNINNQTQRLDGATTASGATICLTPDQSDVVVGTHTGVSGANFTSGFASVPKTTSAHTFEGTAVGASDQLCNSSTVMMIAIAILLWLR